jgi:hypothetical protein
MNGAPRHQSEYDSRQTEAARRVLVDLGQVLAAFHDCFVVVGGWVPDLLISEVKETHVGSIDVDLALDAEKLNDGRYAELLKLLLDTRRYRLGVKPFQLLTDVDLQDGYKPIQVDVEFLASKNSCGGFGENSAVVAVNKEIPILCAVIEFGYLHMPCC